MRSRSAGDDRGSITAEFAVAVPAVLLVLATMLGGVQAAGLQLRLQDAAADAARSLGRGEDAAAVAGRAAEQVTGAELERHAQGELICVRLTAAPSGAAAVLGLRLAATSCALAGGG
jgi:Flp pilus assembly protein TadG